MKRDHASAMVGRPHPRIEGPEKVSGRAKYSADVRLPGQLQGRILRSPHPHARISRIDTTAAEALAGVYAVLSSANAGDIPWYDDDESRLFDPTVRFVGEEVAAVAAESEEIAEDALRLIQVDYEPLPFTVEMEKGRRGKPEVQGRGDPAEGMRQAEVLIDQVYTTQTALHNALETHGCVAAWEGGKLTLHESTQGVFAVRKTVAKKLRLEEEQVRVITQHMGGGFGAKQIAWKHSVIAALLARQCGRPVQLGLDREAENLAVGNRNATRQHVRLGARRDGTLTAIEVDILFQSGAYKTGGEDSDVIGMYQTLYRCPNVRAVQIPVRTNTGPAVAFRAPGYAEAAFALESAMDELARELKMDPIELRLKNYTDEDPKEHRPYTSHASLRRCYEEVGRAFHAYKRNSTGTKRRGIGFAAHDWAAGAGHPPAFAWVRIESDRSATLFTGVQDIGTGPRTALCQIVAEELGLPVENVAHKLGDTELGLYAPTSAGSTTLASLGPAVRAAAVAAIENRHGEGARGPNPFHKSIRTCGAQCVEVEVDTETGEVSVLRVVASHDCGRIVNPLLLDSQVIGGVTQGLGYALTEKRIVDEASGVVLNANLEEYKIPTVGELPDIDNATLSMPDVEANVIGAKGIGEPPIIPTAPAIANAVFDAVGIRIRELPFSREKLLR